MFHKVRNVIPLEKYKLSVQFGEGITKIYDMSKLIQNNKMFRKLEEPEYFKKAKVDVGGYGVIWDDDIDISCDELFENGETIVTPFDGILAFKDATDIWGLNESTLRKAIEYGKFVVGVDVCKFGKQWVVTIKAMEREYGNPSK